MSPIEPLMSREFKRQAAAVAVRVGVDGKALEIALVAVANNFYTRFEKRGKVAFGCLDQQADKEWTKAPVYFVVANRFQTFQFCLVSDQEWTGEEKRGIADKVARLHL